MKVTIQPSAIRGALPAPASKSAMQRACAAALVKGGTSILNNAGFSDDDEAALSIIRSLGAQVTVKDREVTIHSKGIQPVTDVLFCGESGLSLRLFTSLAATHARSFTITGTGSLLKRPIGFFEEVLPQLGVSCSSDDGHLPLQIRGPLVPRDIEIDGSLSSQYLTGLLFAYAALDAHDVTICVRGLNSRPYIDLTLTVMEAFGLKAPIHKDYAEFYFPRTSITTFENEVIRFTIEGDWSGGAFLLAAGAIAGDIKVGGLDVFSTQADKAMLQALMQSEASLSIDPAQIHVRQKKLKAFHINATHSPDLFPPLAALAAFCDGTSVIEGVQRLIHKESNRAQTLQETLGCLGVPVTLQDDLMIIKGIRPKGGEVHSHGDHRIAMAAAILALGADGTTVINGAEAVSKSYPQFWEHLQLLGCSVSLSQ